MDWELLDTNFEINLRQTEVILKQNKVLFFFLKKLHFFWPFLVDSWNFMKNEFFSWKFQFFIQFHFFSHSSIFIKNKWFFFSESWNITLYCRQIHLVNAPIFWRVSSFEALLTNKKIAFWNQIQKLARFSSLWVGWSFWHYHCKERPIFDLGLAWFALVTLKTTSTEKKPKKPFWRWDVKAK